MSQTDESQRRDERSSQTDESQRRVKDESDRRVRTSQKDQLDRRVRPTSHNGDLSRHAEWQDSAKVGYVFCCFSVFISLFSLLFMVNRSFCSSSILSAVLVFFSFIIHLFVSLFCYSSIFVCLMFDF